MDFLRLILIPVVTSLLVISVTWLIIWMTIKYAKRPEVAKIGKMAGTIVTVIVAVVIVVFVIMAAVTNETPRSIINRNGVDQNNQNMQWSDNK